MADQLPKMRFPVTMHLRAANGSLLVYRFVALGAGAELVRVHIVGDAFPEPVYGHVVDQNGQAHRVVPLL